MKLTSSLIFLVVLISSGICAEDTTITAIPTTETTTASAQSTTVTESTTATTSPKPDTTTVSTTTNPTTTTTEPSTTTTVESTTTPLPDTTTSPKPTTEPPVTTTETPTPVEGSWNVTEGNWTCIRADLQVRFDIPVKNGIQHIVLSPNATSGGKCNQSDNTEVLQLNESEFTLRLTFEKDSDNVYLKNITLFYTLPEGSGMVYNDSKLFSVKYGNSYMCSSTSNVNLQNVTMEIMQMHIQAFGKTDNKDFGIAEECSADNKVNDMVPIAVGIALLLLVVVVLVAYFVGRRRSRQKGYQSV